MSVSVTRNKPKFLVADVRSAISLVFLGVLGGCAPSDGGLDWVEQQNRRHRSPAVVAQFCVAGTKDARYLPVMTIKQGSAGSGMRDLVGTTESGQSVFESFLGQVGEFKAVILFHTTSTQQVFFDRRSYKPGAWTDWQPPDQVSDDSDLWYKLVYSRKPGKGTTSPITAYARFKQSSFVEYLREMDEMRKKGLDSTLPSCPPVAINTSERYRKPIPPEPKRWRLSPE
jgi:hypothetical protein